FLVTDQIVVDEIDVATITKFVERLEFGENLIVRFGTRRAAVQLDDVAELAGKRTAARELHADIEILLEFQEIEARYRRLGDVDLEFRGHEHAFAIAPLPSGDEVIDDVFDFAKDPEIRSFVTVRA